VKTSVVRVVGSVALGVLSTLSLAAAAAADSAAERQAAVEQYLKAYPVAEALSDSVNTVARALPEEKRDRFVARMGQMLNAQQLEARMREALVRVFSADELNAMAKFYGSPEGQSVRKKLALYMQEMTPLIQDAMRGAMTKMAGTPRAMPVAPPAKPGP
jgi:hypothetical protein